MDTPWGTAAPGAPDQPFLGRHPQSHCLFSPLCNVQLPGFQGQFTQCLPHGLCFRGHFQSLQEGRGPGESESRVWGEERRKRKGRKSGSCQGALDSVARLGRQEQACPEPFSLVTAGSGSLCRQGQCPPTFPWGPGSPPLPDVVAIIDGRSKLDQALIQRISDCGHSLGHHHLSLASTPLQAYDIPLEKDEPSMGSDSAVDGPCPTVRLFLWVSFLKQTNTHLC